MVDLVLNMPFIFSLKLALRELVHLIRLTRHYGYLKSEHSLTIRIRLQINLVLTYQKVLTKKYRRDTLSLQG